MHEQCLLTFQFFPLAVGEGGAERVDLVRQVLVIIVVQLDVVVLDAAVV